MSEEPFLSSMLAKWRILDTVNYHYSYSKEFSNSLKSSFLPIISGHKPDIGSADTCTNVQSLDWDNDLLDSASSSFDTGKLHDVWLSKSNLSYSTEAKYKAKLMIDNISSPNLNGTKGSVIRDTLEAIAKAPGVSDGVARATDDIVEEDLKRSDGRWMKFEMEAFETGVEIASDMATELGGEIVVDLCI